jgi:polysaccharide pyruvyl transferase CsaB
MTDCYRLVLSNTYGHPNVGDEAILASMVYELSKRIGNVEISVLALRPHLTKRNHPDVQVVKSGVIDGIIPTLRAIRQADLLVVGGGGIIQDQTSLGNLLFHLSRPLAACLLGVPFICYAIGVGPLKAGIGRKLTVAILRRARSIMVRDSLSAELLYQIGIPSELVHVTADPAMTLDYPSDPSRSPIYQKIEAIRQNAKCLVGISLRPLANTYRLLPRKPGETSSSTWFMNEMVQSAKDIIDGMDAHLVFFSMHPEQDSALGHQLAEQVGRLNRLTVVPGSLSPSMMMAAIGLTDLFIGMRLHSLIFAARSTVPMIALAYDPKVEHFMKELGQEKRVLPPDRWSREYLLHLAQDTWRQRSGIESEIAARLPILQDRAKKNVDITIEFLSRSPEKV